MLAVRSATVGSALLAALAAAPRAAAATRATSATPPATSAAPPAGDPADARFKAELQLVGGIRRAPLDDLDAALARDGFTPLSPTRFVGGIGATTSFGRVRPGVDVSIGRAASRSPGGADLATWLTDVDLTVDYELLRYHGVSVFAGTGLLFGWFRIDPDVAGSTLFPPGVGPLQRTYTALPIDLGIDLLIPIARDASLGQALAVGVHGGPLFQLGTSDWETVHGTRAGVTGPDVDTTGFRAVLTIGWALYRAQPP